MLITIISALFLTVLGISIFTIGWICFSDTELRAIGIVMILVGAIILLSPLIYAFVTGQSLKNIAAIIVGSGIILLSIPLGILVLSK